MDKLPFSIERAMRVTNPFAQAAPASGVGFRRSVPLHFEEITVEFGRAPGQSLRMGSGFDGSGRLESLDAMRLHGPSYTVLDGGTSLQLTHVLRHSPAALKWRNGWGEVYRLEPGATFINQGRQDSLVAISPAAQETYCDCVRIVFRTDFANELALRFEAADFPFCNSEEACVRVILGSYREHVGLASPVPQLYMFDIDIAPFCEIEVPVSSNHLALAVLTSGSLESADGPLEPWHAMAFDGREPLARLATQTGAAVLWFAIPRRLASNTADSIRKAGP